MAKTIMNKIDIKINYLSRLTKLQKFQQSLRYNYGKNNNEQN